LAPPSRDQRTELQQPAPHRFVGDVEPALGQQFLHVVVAQRKAKIQPNRVLDDLRREAMAAIAEQGHAHIPARYATYQPTPVSVTMPCLVVTGSIIDGRNILDRELVRRPQIGVTLFTLPMHILAPSVDR
jgi:hypothetical protein